MLFTPFNVEIYISQLRALDLGLDFILDDIIEYANEVTNSVKGFDWASDEGKTYLRSKLNSIINSELQHTKQKAECDDIVQLESVDILNSKNVIEKKQHLLKNFFNGKLLKPNKVCTFCNTRKAGMNVINKSLIVLTASKAVTSVKKFDAENGNSATDISVEMKGKSYLTPSQAREHLRCLWNNEKEVLLRLFPFLNIDLTSNLKIDDKSCRLDVFFWETIIVTPNRFRPLRFLNGRSFEHYRTSALSELMIVAKSLQSALDNAKQSNDGNSVARFHLQWQRLQILCNRLYDSQMDNLPDNKAVGLKQILEKKEGLLRKNMMGKRVNFAARSVISPDPYIMVDEIGIPTVFATKLSYPQPVTNWNVKKLQEMVINGPNKHPGALSVMHEDGFVVRLKPDDIGQRRSIAATLHAPSLGQGLNGIKVVNRHLCSGDVLLLNRQPTLHKPSIMAHKARVLPREKTLRLHYANCKCYNADFDGDEMNAHFPQSELARAEAYNIASVNYQFLVPKDGSPLSGLIQDHIVAGVLLSVRGRFFNKNDYQELVYGALSFLNRPIKYLPPTIWKPEKLWSGKQVISTLVINLTPPNKPFLSFEIDSKINSKMLISGKPKEWISGGTKLKENEMCESQVIFHKGELLCGIMDKVNMGASKNGLVHCCFELYGGDVHSRLLTAMARLSTNFLQSIHGFTLGIHDVLVRKKANAKRKKFIEQSKELGQQAVANAFSLTNLDELTDEILHNQIQFAHTSRNDFYMKQLDSSYKSQTDSLANQVSAACLPKGLVQLFPGNNLQMMIQAGAKGGSVNAIQISCLLGQIELEGRRIPLMMSGRTLPSFTPYDVQPRAGGFVTGRFLTGIRPQEFFFHCMAGREGLIDTAVKTSRSGYLQRCLIKHLEGLVVNYDLTVRDSEGSVVQWLYGEDGLDITRSQSLKKSFFPNIVKNKEALKATPQELITLKTFRDDSVSKDLKTLRKLLIKSSSSPTSECRLSPFLLFEQDVRSKTNSITKTDLLQQWHKLEECERKRYANNMPKVQDPILFKYRPDLNVGSISETLNMIIQNYCDEQITNRSLVKEFKNTLNLCYMRALCAPGEAVGLLAAQSIGEPSTQMTLNTFHFAGRGEMNVTLGIPRLREILMTASSNISTPSMSIPFRVDLSPDVDLETESEKVRLRMNAVKLKDVLEYVDVSEHIEINDTEYHHRYRVYQIRFCFLPRSYYKRRCFTKPEKIVRYIEGKFLKQLLDVLNRRLRLLTKSHGLFDTKGVSLRERNVSKKVILDDEEEMMMQNNDNDVDYKDNEQKKSLLDEDDDEDDDLEELDAAGDNEGDTTATKHRARLTQEREYEEAEQDEMETNNESDVDDNEEDNDDMVAKHNVKLEVEQEEVAIPLENVISSIKEKDDAYIERRAKVLNLGSGYITDYSYDSERHHWCDVTLKFELMAAKLDIRSIIEEEANRAYVHRVGRIDRAFLVKDALAAKRNAPFAQMIQTEGVSLSHVVEFERFLDLRRIYTNDMHAIARNYGIEAARAALVREITNVFAVYGITVDGRHLSLITDHMTFTGTIKGMNRGAMDGISPLQAMTFETTTNFLKNSLLLGGPQIFSL